MSNTTDASSQTPTRRHVPFGWVVLGLFLLPILLLLVWANYQLLALGLEAVFGFNRIEWVLVGRVFTVEDVVATAGICAELLSGFLFAELAGWVNLLDFDEHLGVRQRRTLMLGMGLLCISLVAGEVGIGIYRQRVIERQARLHEEAVHALSAPLSEGAQTVGKREVDLTKRSHAADELAGPTTPTAPARGSGLIDARRAGFVDSLPFVATVLIHITVPCLSAAVAVIVSPLTFFATGLTLTVSGVVPLTCLCIVLDLLGWAVRGIFGLLLNLLQLVAAPMRILIEGLGGRRPNR